MSKAMEEFFKKHRAEFDDQVPGNHVWDGIRHSMRQASGNIIYWKVAAVFFFCCSAWLLYSGQTGSNGIKENNLMAQSSLKNIEDFYAVKINQRESWLRGYEQDFASVSTEYQRLTAMYEVLKLAWEKNPGDELRDAMALNLILRLDMLDRLTESGFQVQAQKANSAGLVYR